MGPGAHHDGSHNETAQCENGLVTWMRMRLRFIKRPVLQN